LLLDNEQTKLHREKAEFEDRIDFQHALEGLADWKTCAVCAAQLLVQEFDKYEWNIDNEL
jgi:hypothetical protein